MTSITKITIRFGRDKNGRQIAHKWSALTIRWLPITVENARLKLATDPRYQLAEKALKEENGQ